MIRLEFIDELHDLLDKQFPEEQQYATLSDDDLEAVKEEVVKYCESIDVSL